MNARTCATLAPSITGANIAPNPSTAAAACAARSPRAGTALSTTAAVVPAKRLTSKLAGIAARSTAEGRHGTNTKSATRAASTAPPASRGAMSMIARDAPGVAGRIEHARQAGGMGGDYWRQVVAAKIAPDAGATLGIQVDDDRLAGSELVGDGQGDGQRCLSASALL